MKAALEQGPAAGRARPPRRNEPPFAQRLENLPWFEAGVPLAPEVAWTRLAESARGAAARPYCVYVHVPYCASICSFCALYTRAVPGHADAVFDAYLQTLHSAAAAHPMAYRGRVPTTVHFGGGTPLHLGLARFEALVGLLRGAFGDAPGCEWAVEVTTSSMIEEAIERLAALRVRRIHLGIQTLDDGLRRRHGRRESGAAALGRIERLLALGFAVSVDLIMGLEGASEAILADDLRRLHAAGVRVYSICELRPRGARARRAAQAAERSECHARQWALIWNHMREAGLQPIHLGQFGRSQADNLYYTHPARGEDCVALGPYAHGSAGLLAYGNLLAPAYEAAVAAARAPLAVATLYDDATAPVLDLERELLAHRVRGPTLDRMLHAYPRFADVLQSWHAFGLLRPVAGDGVWALTMPGSWYVGNLVEQARSLSALCPDVRGTAAGEPARQAAAGVAQ